MKLISMDVLLIVLKTESQNIICYNRAMLPRKYNVIIPADMKPRPKPHEESAAALLSIYFQSDTNFIKTTRRETPDISIRGIEWEIKSPVGGGKNNMQKNMREAARQANNVVLIFADQNYIKTELWVILRNSLNDPIH